MFLEESKVASDGCLEEWRSPYGVDEEMRRKCPICRAHIPPSREMVITLEGYLAAKQRMEKYNDTTSEDYHSTCLLLKGAEEDVGADWNGVTVLEDSNATLPMVMPNYIAKAIRTGDTKLVLRWINANRAEDRVNAVTSIETLCVPLLTVACTNAYLTLMALLLQLGADVDGGDCKGYTALRFTFSSDFVSVDSSERILRLLLGWGATFFPERGTSREACISIVEEYGRHELADLVESELGGRRCEIVNLSSRPELNGKTCVVDKYLSDSNRYKVTLETKSKEVLVLGPDNLKRRDRTPQDCGYYVEFKNGRTVRHDFDSSEDCKAFVAAQNRDETQPSVTGESEARAEQAAAELLAELGLDDSPIESSGGCMTKKSKKKKGGKKKKKK